MTNPSDPSAEFDQAARIALIEQYSSDKRYWGTNLLSLGIGIFTLVIANQREGLPIPIFWMVLIGMIIGILYCLPKMLWYGTLLQFVLAGNVQDVKGHVDSNRSYLYWVEQRAATALKARNKKSYDYLYYLTHQQMSWFWSAAIIESMAVIGWLIYTVLMPTWP